MPTRAKENKRAPHGPGPHNPTPPGPTLSAPKPKAPSPKTTRAKGPLTKATPRKMTDKPKTGQASKITPGFPAWISVPQDTRNKVQQQYVAGATPAEQASILANDFTVIQAVLTGPRSMLRRHLDHDHLPLTSFLERINGIPLEDLKEEADTFFQAQPSATGSPNNEDRDAGGGS